MSDARKDLYNKRWQETKRGKRLLSDFLTSSFLKEKLKKENVKFLDLGCGNLSVGKYLKNKLSNVDYLGIDFSDSSAILSQKLNLNFLKHTFDSPLPIDSNSFDIIYFSHVIEHLFYPDIMLEEIYRILKDDGYLIIGTPNLASWFNRILLLLGIQPISTELSFKYSQCGRGFLKKFRKIDSISGHIRIMTLNGLMDLLDYHGFKMVKVKGEPYGALNEIKKYKLFVSFVKNLDNFFANYFPSLAHGIWILAEKK